MLVKRAETYFTARYGINRADHRFWETHDWFKQRFDHDEPVRGGLLDLNRYYYQAQEQQQEQF
ncbi:MAG: fatty acid cis/trans isomerase [Trichlorobacter sp.]